MPNNNFKRGFTPVDVAVIVVIILGAIASTLIFQATSLIYIDKHLQEISEELLVIAEQAENTVFQDQQTVETVLEPTADELERDFYIVDGVTVTHYCPCSKCCGKWANGITAYGNTPVAGVTVAANPNFLPEGTRVEIDGHIYTVEDTGVSGKAIDIFCDTHQEAINRGTYQTTIKIMT